LRSPEHRSQAINGVVADLAGILRAKALAERLGNGQQARVLAFLYLEGRLGALLNIGAQEGVEPGTPLLIYRVDSASADGLPVESLLGLLFVTYVQAGSNCSHARVQEHIGDTSYWMALRKLLRRQPRVAPPANFVLPSVPRELGELSSVDLTSVVNVLGMVGRSLAAFHRSVQQGEEER
jgi:hypothetical protein